MTNSLYKKGDYTEIEGVQYQCFMQNAMYAVLAPVVVYDQWGSKELRLDKLIVVCNEKFDDFANTQWLSTSPIKQK